MLRFLSIRQLAVIDVLEVEFGPGLNVLTGETGAGKSIIVEAVDLLLGGRSSADLVRTGSEAAQVQAVLEPEASEELIVRREVSASGRSRAFVDGNLVTSAQLRDVTGPLIDLHGQHEHQSLLAAQNHLALLDRFAGVDGERSVVADAYAELSRVRGALAACRLDERERAARLDLLTFQLAEIEKASPRPGEDEELAVERQRLASADRIRRLASDAYHLLYESDHAVVGSLAQVWRRVTELTEVDPAYTPYLDARDPIRSQLEDLAGALRSSANDLDASPERLQQVEDRLATLIRLKKRHGPSLADVISKRETLKTDIDALSTAAERAATLEQTEALAGERFLVAARRLSAIRRRAAGDLGLALSSLLKDLAMPSTRFEVRFQGGEEGENEGHWSASGFDVAEFYFSANPGEVPRPLARIASGGELSRVMLALKTLASTDAFGKTLIFDEIDAGIGGGVADILGERLRALGTRFQVLCITHLPQIAAHGHLHFQVTKAHRGGRAVTEVRKLDPDDRVEEIARMISGSAVTASVRASAQEMLAARAKGESKAKGESETLRVKGRK